MYPSRPVFLHSSALSPEEYPIFLSWVHDLRLPARPSKLTSHKEATQDDLTCHDIRADDVGRFLLESFSLQESHWEEILAIFHPAHRSLQPRHSISQSHLRSLSPFNSEEVFVVLRLAWHALGGRYLGLEGQNLIFTQATPPPVSSQPSAGQMVSSPSSISPSRFSANANNLPKLLPPPQHQDRKVSASNRTLPSTTEGKATSPMAFPSIYAKPSPYIRRGSISPSISDFLATLAVSPPPPPPPPPPPQRIFRAVSEPSSSGAIRKASEELTRLSSASPSSSSLSVSSSSFSSSSEDSNANDRSGFDRLRYKTPMSDDGSSIDNSTAEVRQNKTELLLEDLNPPQVVSPNSNLVLIDEVSASNPNTVPSISSSNPFRARLHSASMLPAPGFPTRSQSLAGRPVLSIVSPPLPPRPGLADKPHSAPPLPPRESLLPSWSSSSLATRSTIESNPPLPPVEQKVSVPRESRRGVPKVPTKPCRLQTRPSNSISAPTGFQTTMLIQQSLLAAEDARKKDQTKAERERRVEVIGSSAMSHGDIHRSRSKDEMTVGLGLRENEGGSKWATVSAHTGLNKNSTSKGGHHYHRYHSTPLTRSLISSFQALMKPPPPPAPSRLSSSSSKSSSALPYSDDRNSDRSPKKGSFSSAHRTESFEPTSPTRRIEYSTSPESTSRVLLPPPPRRSSTIASLSSRSSASMSTNSTSQQPRHSLVRAHSLITTIQNDQWPSADDTLKEKLRGLGNKAEEGVDWLRDTNETKKSGISQGTQRSVGKYRTKKGEEQEEEVGHNWARLR